jgi:hypothetical protein
MSLTKANTRMLEGNLPISQVPEIPNTKLAHDSITINGSAVALGGSTTIATGGTNTPAFCVRETDQQTISHNTITNLTFGTEEVDTDSAFSSNQFTVPSGKAGLYYLEVQANFYDANSNITSGTLWIYKGTNATKISNLYNTFTDAADRSHHSFQTSVIANLSVGDVIGCTANVTTSDSGTLTSYGGDNGTRFMGFKLA